MTNTELSSIRTCTLAAVIILLISLPTAEARKDPARSALDETNAAK